MIEEQSLAELGEFGLIARIASKSPRPDSAKVGNGDDAAVISLPSAEVVIATDSVIEGRHFSFEWSSGHDVGRKIAARAMADIAAMGGVAIALVVAFAGPPDLSAALAEAISDGLAAEAASAGAAVVGGDVASASMVSITVTAIGTMRDLEPVTRSGARVGDGVYLAGLTGRSAAGMRLLQAGERSGSLVDAHRVPQVDYAMGPLLAAAGATALIDISDGLIADIGHIADLSGVGIEIDSSCVASVEGVSLQDALSGGEDHAFAACFPSDATVPPGVARIGVVVEGKGVLVDGGPVAGGWDHFKDSE